MKTNTVIERKDLEGRGYVSKTYVSGCTLFINEDVKKMIMWNQCTRKIIRIDNYTP